jgi:hypothetical protein
MSAPPPTTQEAEAATNDFLPLPPPSQTGENPPPNKDHEEEKSKPPPRKQFTIDDWAQLIQMGEPVLKFLADKWEAYEKRGYEADERSQRHTIRVLGVLMGFLGGIIVLVAWLTYEGKVSGDALLFLIGTVAGVILSMVQRHLFSVGPEE